MYLQCSNGYEYIFTCPLDLVFNEILQVCDYVENVPECNGEITTSMHQRGFQFGLRGPGWK